MKPQLLRKAFFPGKYIQGPGALDQLPELVRLFGSRGLIIASPTSYESILPASGIQLGSAPLSVERFSRECCETELARLAEIVRGKKVDVLVGMGGGKAIDTAKIAADRANIPVIVIPTIASTDAPCSGCAVVYSQQGVFESVYYQKSNPTAVLVDTEIIVKSPARFLVSGMGDALATWFEARSCSQAHSPNVCGGLATLAGLNLARLCYDTLLSYGVSARLAAERHVITPALERIVEANILLSGIGFESGGLATAHAIHNGLTALEETHAFYHGEKVAFGVLAGLQITDTPPEESEAAFSFCEAVGLPTTLADIGLGEVDEARLMAASEKACAPEESIHNEACGVSPRNILYAMVAADAIGRSRKERARKG